MADWKSLTDGEWVNIVNSDAVKAEGSYVHGAVCAAFKLIEARLREKNEPKTALDHFIDGVEAAVGAWQPIETAPRLNGQRVLLSRNGGNGPFHAIGYALDGVPGWHCNECRGMETLEEVGYTVTHWMPLPKVPGDQP